MTFSAKSNIYEANAKSTIAAYGDFIDGTGAEVVLALSEGVLSETAASAIESSMAALGFGERACAFVALDAGDMALGASDLMSVVEGLDPLALVVCDARAAELLGHAYRTAVALDAKSRVMGREVVAFRDFEAMLSDGAQKQRAWALLKTLRHG